MFVILSQTTIEMFPTCPMCLMQMTNTAVKLTFLSFSEGEKLLTVCVNYPVAILFEKCAGGTLHTQKIN